MPLLSIALILAAGMLILFILKKQEARRRKSPEQGGYLEYRSPLALDECMDALRVNHPEDLFQYTCRRQPDGAFLLNITLHQPTHQPMDTVFALRLDAGRETVVTLHFIREAFGYDRPVFPTDMLDEFMRQKLSARRVELPEY